MFMRGNLPVSSHGLPRFARGPQRYADPAFGRVKPGDHVLLAGFGSGLTWGATLLKWA